MNACISTITQKDIVWKIAGDYNINKTDTGFYLYAYHHIDLIIDYQKNHIKSINPLQDSIIKQFMIAQNHYQPQLYSEIYKQISYKPRISPSGEYTYSIPTLPTFGLQNVRFIERTPFWRGDYNKYYLLYEEKGKNRNKKFDLTYFYGIYQIYPIGQEHFIIDYSTVVGKPHDYVGIICLSSRCKEIQ